MLAIIPSRKSIPCHAMRGPSETDAPPRATLSIHVMTATSPGEEIVVLAGLISDSVTSAPRVRGQTRVCRIILAIGTAVVVIILILAAQLSIQISALLPADLAIHTGIQDSEWCRYGTLPGTWVSDSNSGWRQHWRILDNRCQLKDMLSIYAGSHMSMVHNNSGDPELRVIGNESIEGTEIEGDLSDGPIANIMFIGDSVDRHILQ